MSEALTTVPEKKDVMILSMFPTFEKALSYCEVIASAGLSPAFNTAAKVFACFQLAEEIGIGKMQALMSMYPVKGRMGMMGDLILGKIQASGFLESMKTERVGEPKTPESGIRVTMKRKDQAEPYVGEFTWGDAMAAGLSSKDTYKGYGKDMLFWRAFARAARGFADITKGLVVYEDYISAEVPKVEVQHTQAHEDRLLTSEDETFDALVSEPKGNGED